MFRAATLTRSRQERKAIDAIKEDFKRGGVEEAWLTVDPEI